MSFKKGPTFIPTRTFRSIVKSVPVATVDIVIFSQDYRRVLLSQRSNRPAQGSWYTIGGRLHKHESFVHAAVRHLKTELGIRIKPTALWFGGIINEEFKDSAHARTTTHNVNIFFGLKLTTTKYKPDRQHSELAWLPVRSPKIHSFVKQKIQTTLSSRP